IVFSGGTKSFNPVINSPFETAQRHLAGALLNASTIGQFQTLIRYPPCGEEMLVITNPATDTAANNFATARTPRRLLTPGGDTGNGVGQAGTTATQIQSYIRGQLTTTGLLCVHPSYVTIMGDNVLVPTFTNGPDSISGSDLKYSLKDNADELPDVAVGRIIGEDATQVGGAVSKIVGHETTPLSGPILTHATIAAYFQDATGTGQETRTFVQFAETVRNGLVARGVTVDRVYTTEATENPQKFNDGTDLPSALKRPTFAWNGSGADVSADWNAGRFLIIHRDHG